ncbi:MAG: hypothetical protein KGO51_11350, partial [Alphaproteobacteria bacterium]|nr:hypothetical protein [Alphaproteobacteria bacterium]
MGKPNPWRLAAGLSLALAMTATAAPAGPKATRPTPARPEFVAFYIPWDAAALASLKAHVDDVDVLSPMWASLVSPAGKVVWESDEPAHAVLAAAAHRPVVMPILTNAHDDIWDTAAAEAVILKPAAGAAFARNLIRHARDDRLAGIVLDFENLTPKATAAYPAFLKALRAKLGAAGLELWVTSTLTAEDGL